MLTLLYDDGCGVCRAMAQFVRRRNARQRIELLPLSTSEAALSRWHIDPATARTEVHLIGEDGQIRRGIAIVQPVLRQLTLWRWIAPLFKVWPMSYLLVGGWLLLQQLRHRH